MFRWITGVAIGAALLALAVGCGGGDDSTTELTKAEFSKQANAICAKAKDERTVAYEKYAEEVQGIRTGNKSVPKEEQKLADEMIDATVIPTLQDQLAQLEELAAPTADEATISKMLKNLSKGTGELEEGGVRQFINGGKLTTFQEEAETYGISCSVL